MDNKTKKKWIAGMVVILILTNILTFLVTNVTAFYLPNGKVLIGRKEYNELKKFDKMFEVKNLLYKTYDGEINEDSLVEGAVKGMTSSIKDPYTVFWNKKQYEDFNFETHGEYSGLGILTQIKDENNMRFKDNKIHIADVFDDSPAKKAGVLPKDIIEKINGKAVTADESDDAVSMMKGKEGTKVTLTLYRENKGVFDVELKTAKISNITVKALMLDDNMGYIKVSMFDENTAKSLKNKLKELKTKGMKSLVLDLRGNPGGVLEECVEMVSNFLDQGKVIVSTKGKFSKEKIYKSKGGDFIGLPLVVLTNEGSASASEIFVGAIKDYKIGTIIGDRTFGKGIVQTIQPFKDGTALKVTISKYYTPSGENIHKKGIEPDIQVKYPTEPLQKEYRREEDPQLQKAIQVLKEKAKK